ncbi:MAG: glycine/sarcosine/betaine reductase selenoprotein B family protein [Acidimicrobiia bacterium]
MTDPAPSTETLEEFAQSLSYGKRSDLSFKFLARLGGPRIGDSLAQMLEAIGALFDTGDPVDLIELATRLQAEGYQSRPLNERYRYDEGPFTRSERPVAESQVSLLTSSGHFATGDDPQPLGVRAMTQVEAEERIGEFLKEVPTLSEIATVSSADAIEVRHGGYDIRGSMADHNVSFPIDRLRELETDGVIGSLHETAYSFVGACAQTRLIKQNAPEWADRLKSTGSDVVLLIPV